MIPSEFDWSLHFQLIFIFVEPVYIETKVSQKEDLAANCEACAKFIEWFHYLTSKDARSQEEKEFQNTMDMLMGKMEDEESASLMSIHDLMLCRRVNIPVVNELIIWFFALVELWLEDYWECLCEYYVNLDKFTHFH